MNRKLLLGFVIAATAACGGQPLSAWKVSAVKGVKADSCYVNNTNPNVTHSETDTAQVDLGMWELYEGPGEKFYLTQVDRYPGVVNRNRDLSGYAIEGTLGDDDSYTFNVTDTIVMRDQEINTTATATFVYSDAISFTLDGDTLTGTWAEGYTADCVGTNCDPNFNTDQDNMDCNVSHQLTGRLMEATYENRL